MSASFMPAPSPSATVADLNPLLLDAKNIYVNQLSEAVGPYILKTLEALYAEVLQGGSSKVLLRFQAKLKEIPLWNSTLIEEHAAAIEAKFPYLADLIAAAFVAYVKVMSSIKLRSDKPNIRLKLPTNPAFVHKAFINVARDFYVAPQLAENVSNYQTMRVAVEKTIRDMLPIRDILKAYLGNTVDDAHTVSPTLDDSESSEDEEDNHGGHGGHGSSPSLFDTPSPSPVPAPVMPVAVPEAAPQPVHAPVLAPAQPAQPAQPMQPMQPMQPTVAVSCDTKTISIPPIKDDDLFSDADDSETDWKHS